MARVARERSSTGIYHIVFQGINRQIIFEDDQDRMRFLDTLERYKAECGYEFYGYCLMHGIRGRELCPTIKYQTERIDHSGSLNQPQGGHYPNRFFVLRIIRGHLPGIFIAFCKRRQKTAPLLFYC